MKSVQKKKFFSAICHRLFLLFIICLSETCLVYGEEWIHIGLEGKNVLCCAIDPVDHDIMYVGTLTDDYNNDYVYKSTNGGVTWENTSLFRSVSAIVIDPLKSNILYAGAWLTDDYHQNWELYKSWDSGLTWSVIRSAPAYAGGSQFIVIDPHNSEIVYAGVYTDPSLRGVLKTTDGGNSWVLIFTTAPYACAIDSHDPDTLYITSKYNIHKSTNAGKSWSSTGFYYGLAGAIAIDPDEPQTVYAGILYNGDGIYQSKDGGQSWQPTGFTGKYIRDIVINPSNPAILYAAASGDNKGVYVSSDAGNTWSAFDNGLIYNSVYDLELQNDGAALYATSYGNGLYRTSLNPIVVPELRAFSLIILLGILGCSMIATTPGSRPLFRMFK